MPHMFSPRCGVECSLSIPQVICLKNICTPCGSYVASVPMNTSILLLGEAPYWYFLVNYSWEQELKNSMSLILSHLILMTALWGKYNIISFFILYTYWTCTWGDRQYPQCYWWYKDKKMWSLSLRSLSLQKDSELDRHSQAMWWGYHFAVMKT